MLIDNCARALNVTLHFPMIPLALMFQTYYHDYKIIRYLDQPITIENGGTCQKSAHELSLVKRNISIKITKQKGIDLELLHPVHESFTLVNYFVDIHTIIINCN